MNEFENIFQAAFCGGFIASLFSSCLTLFVELIVSFISFKSDKRKKNNSLMKPVDSDER